MRGRDRARELATGRGARGLAHAGSGRAFVAGHETRPGVCDRIKLKDRRRATSRSSWRRRGYTTGRAGHLHQVCKCAPVQGRRAALRGAPQARRGQVQVARRFPVGRGRTPTTSPHGSTLPGHLTGPYLASRDLRRRSQPGPLLPAALAARAQPRGVRAASFGESA